MIPFLARMFTLGLVLSILPSVRKLFSGFDSPGWRELRRVTPMLGQAFHRLREEAGREPRPLRRVGPEAGRAHQRRRSELQLD